MAVSYSVLKLFTGFAIAAFSERNVIVEKAISNVIAMDNAKTPIPIWIRNLKSCRYLFMNHQAIGAAMTKAMNSSWLNSFPNIHKILFTPAPNTLRMPISFVF